MYVNIEKLLYFSIHLSSIWAIHKQRGQNFMNFNPLLHSWKLTYLISGNLANPLPFKCLWMSPYRDNLS